MNFEILEYILYVTNLYNDPIGRNEHLESMKDTWISLAGSVNGSFLVLWIEHIWIGLSRLGNVHMTMTWNLLDLCDILWANINHCHNLAKHLGKLNLKMVAPSPHDSNISWGNRQAACRNSLAIRSAISLEFGQFRSNEFQENLYSPCIFSAIHGHLAWDFGVDLPDITGCRKMITKFSVIFFPGFS